MIAATNLADSEEASSTSLLRSNSDQIALQKLNRSSAETYLSLYHGSFDDIGTRLAPLTNNFEDFNIITNVPYGVQS